MKAGETILLFSSLEDAVYAFKNGLDFKSLNPRQHAFLPGEGSGVCANICLDSNDLARIAYLEEKGVFIDSRSVPGEKKVDLSKLAFLKKRFL